jgi:hypothetical protein
MKSISTLLFFVLSALVVRDVVVVKSQSDNSADPDWPRQINLNKDV